MLINEIVSEMKQDIIEVDLGNDIFVNVKQYLPSVKKNNLLEIVLQKSATSTILNTYVLNILFDLYLTLEYSDLEATEEELNDPFGLYDKLESNGIINKIIGAIPPLEYKELYEALEELKDNLLKYQTSTSSTFDKISIFIDSLVDVLSNTNFEELKSNISSFIAEQKGE